MVKASTPTNANDERYKEIGRVNPFTVNLYNADLSKKIVITNLVQEVSIVEDIFKNTMYGAIRIKDAVDLLGGNVKPAEGKLGFPIVGEEFVEVIFASEYNDRQTRFRFAVYGITNLIYTQNLRVKEYTLELCSEEHLIDASTVIMKKYEGKNSESVKAVCRDYLNLDDGSGSVSTSGSNESQPTTTNPRSADPASDGRAPIGFKTPSEVEANKVIDFAGGDTGTYANFKLLDPAVQAAFYNAANDYYVQTGQKLKMTKGQATLSQQEQQYSNRSANTANTESAAKPSATTPHANATSVGIKQGADSDKIAIAALNKYGLYQTKPNDPSSFSIKSGTTQPAPNKNPSANTPASQAGLPNAPVPAQANNNVTGTGKAPGTDPGTTTDGPKEVTTSAPVVGFTDKKKLKFVEPTKGDQLVVIPRLSPLQTLEFFARRSISDDENYQSGTYLFFENSEGYNFCDVENLIKNGIDRALADEKTYRYYFEKALNNPNVTKDPDREYKTIMKLQHKHYFDTVEKLKLGVYESDMTTYDFVQQKAVSTRYRFANNETKDNNNSLTTGGYPKNDTYPENTSTFLKKFISADDKQIKYTRKYFIAKYSEVQTNYNSDENMGGDGNNNGTNNTTDGQGPTPTGSNTTAVNKNLGPHIRALLDTIASKEGNYGSYAIGYTNPQRTGSILRKTFDPNNMPDHPHIVNDKEYPPIWATAAQGKYGSTGAGRYAFEGRSTWPMIKQNTGLKAFTPENQDQGCWWLAKYWYKIIIGGDLDPVLKAAAENNDTAALNKIKRAYGDNRWAIGSPGFNFPAAYMANYNKLKRSG